MKKLVCILLVICTLFSLCGCSKDKKETAASGTIEGKGYKSPEKAILAYAESLQSGDVKKILSTFAIETYVDKMDMGAYLSATAAYSVSTGLVSSDDYSREIRLVQRQYQITQQLGYMYINHTEAGFPEKLQPIPVPPAKSSEYGTIDAFIEDMTVEDWDEILEEMEIGDVRTDADLIRDNLTAAYYDNLDRRAAQYGCDEIVPLAIEITLDGVDCYLCADVACYGGKWYILFPSGTLGAILGVDAMSCGLVER